MSGSQTLLHVASQAPVRRCARAVVLSLRLGDGNHRQPEQEPHWASTGTQHGPLVAELQAAGKKGWDPAHGASRMHLCWGPRMGTVAGGLVARGRSGQRGGAALRMD